jgi:hypothetical protein
MSFEVEMIIPPLGEDELGQRAEATYNFLKYIECVTKKRDG